MQYAQYVEPRQKDDLFTWNKWRRFLTLNIFLHVSANGKVLQVFVKKPNTNIRYMVRSLFEFFSRNLIHRTF